MYLWVLGNTFVAFCLQANIMVAWGGENSGNPVFHHLFAITTLRSLCCSGLGYIEANGCYIPLSPLQLRYMRLDSEEGYNIPFSVWVMGRLLCPYSEGWHFWAPQLHSCSSLGLEVWPYSSPQHNITINAVAQNQHLLGLKCIHHVYLWENVLGLNKGYRRLTPDLRWGKELWIMKFILLLFFCQSQFPSNQEMDSLIGKSRSIFS